MTVVLNGIPDLSTRGDLLDRSVTIQLYPIKERKTEFELRNDMEHALPPALRGLLDALVMGLARYSSIPTPNIRMADFARLVIAAEPALPWAPGAFVKVYEQSRDQALAILIDGDVVAREVTSFSQHHRNGWNGLASDLLDQLNLNANQRIRQSADWPRRPNWLSARLARLAAGLRARGVEVASRRTNRGAEITLTNIAPLATPGGTSDANVDSSSARHAPSTRNGFAEH